MSAETLYQFAADALLMAHALFVAFVVLGALAIYPGRWLSWAWVRNFWFRLLHMVSIAIVVLLSWLGAICPLTEWEIRLRLLAGEEAYAGSFIEHWVSAILYYDAPAWVFIVIYTLFGAFILASWFIIPPTRQK